jgi:hypothetical protein
MSARRAPESVQLGFDALLANADSANLTREVARECAHLPGAMEEALPLFRTMIDRHHAAMVAGDQEQVMKIREEADRLAFKLNNYQPGIIADYGAPGCVLDRATRAPVGSVPLWGQSGTFEISIGTMGVRIAMEGLFGISAHCIRLIPLTQVCLDVVC